MRKRLVQLAAVGLVALGASAYTSGAFGGWAVITVEDLPQTLAVAQPTTLTFSVRQHGQKLLGDLSPTVEATDGSASISARARPVLTRGAGYYATSLTVPRAGNWTVTINSGFLNNHIRLLPIPAAAAGPAARPIVADADVGERLFVAKGCVTCHVHGAVTGYLGANVGPNLTPKRYVADYLAKLLADPSIGRPAGAPSPANASYTTFPMPNLGLQPREITALVAFINADRTAASR